MPVDTEGGFVITDVLEVVIVEPRESVVVKTSVVVELDVVRVGQK